MGIIQNQKFQQSRFFYFGLLLSTVFLFVMVLPLRANAAQQMQSPKPQDSMTQEKTCEMTECQNKYAKCAEHCVHNASENQLPTSAAVDYQKFVYTNDSERFFSEEQYLEKDTIVDSANNRAPPTLLFLRPIMKLE